MKEADLQSAVIETARIFGWRVAHFRAAQTSKGWRTPVTADGQGFPDLVLVRERVVYAELKGRGGKMAQEQGEWLRSLHRAGQEAYVWYPSSWVTGEIEDILRREIKRSAA